MASPDIKPGLDYPESPEPTRTELKSPRSRSAQASWRDDHIRDRRIKGFVSSWQDPQKKKDRTARTHSQEAEALRSKFWEDHPEKVEERSRNLRKGVEKAEQAKQARMKEKLGEDPAGELRRLYSNLGYTQTEIGTVLHIDENTVADWMRTLGVEARRGNRGRNRKLDKQ